MIGARGASKESTVSREERFIREPSLRAALAYELIYGKPIRELFAGLYEQVEQDVAERARVLCHRLSPKVKPKRQEVIASLVSKLTVSSNE